MAISFRRAVNLASKRLATLAHATSNTQPTAAKSVSNIGRCSPTRSSWNETTLMPAFESTLSALAV
jgi:hypothetical protein